MLKREAIERPANVVARTMRRNRGRSLISCVCGGIRRGNFRESAPAMSRHVGNVLTRKRVEPDAHSHGYTARGGGTAFEAVYRPCGRCHRESATKLMRGNLAEAGH